MKLILSILFMFVFFNVGPLWAKESIAVEVNELGFLIHKPAEWNFFQELNTPFGQDNPTVPSLLSHYARTPVVAISKFPAQYAEDINPNIRITIKPVNRMNKKNVVDPDEPVNLLQGIVTSLKSVLQNLRVEKPSSPMKLSGFHAAFARMSYTMQLITGEQTRGNSDLWLVMPSSQYVFLISGVTREDQGNGTRKELQAIVNTINIQSLKK